MSRLGNVWLCEAWGETDRPSAALEPDREGVCQFIVNEWMGSDKDPELPEVMQQFDSHDWRDGPLEWRFEIGGVRISDVFDNRLASRGQDTKGQRDGVLPTTTAPDAEVIDETPAAYKSIEAVMAAQTDLVDVVHTLKQVCCVKG